MSFPLRRTEFSSLFNGSLEGGVFLERYSCAKSQLIYLIVMNHGCSNAADDTERENKNNLKSTSVPFKKPRVRLARQRREIFSLFQPHESEEDAKPCETKNSYAKPWIFRPTVEWLIRGWFFYLWMDEIIKRMITLPHADVYLQLFRLHLGRKSKIWRRLLMFHASVGERVLYAEKTVYSDGNSWNSLPTRFVNRRFKIIY